MRRTTLLQMKHRKALMGMSTRQLRHGSCVRCRLARRKDLQVSTVGRLKGDQ